jgi:CheY-like chemotaxis protein/two-component sensor histidine kinase
LAPIQTALQLMRLRGTCAAERERTVIQRQVTHLTRLVDDLLDVSRITRGKVTLKRERVEISDVVAKAIETSSPLLEQRLHTVTMDVARRGLMVDGDHTRLAQVVSNLLTNAAKYTETGGHITIQAGRDGAEIVLSVRDTGIGIPSELLPNVFDLFVQGRQSVERSHGGLGLGLTIVRSLVTLHGGTVSVRSEGLGRGSEFTVRLPAAPVRAADIAGAHLPNAVAEYPPTGLRLLVVDDNEDAAEMLGQALALKGHHARVVHDGPAAIRAAEEFRPDVALLDIGLPVMDGYEVGERLRSLDGFQHLRLIAITGYGQDADRARSRAAGFESHLVKPIDLDVLDELLTSSVKQ